MNQELKGPGKLLDSNGALAQRGWAKQLVLQYDAADIQANRLRIKEWDYYIVLNAEGRYGLATVIADNRYMGLATCTFFDYENGKQVDFLVPKIFPMGKLGMPPDSAAGDICCSDRHCILNYTLEPRGRHLYGRYTKSLLHGEIEFDIFLSQPPMDTMVIATPWAEKATAFYYNQKINCMRAEGYVKIGGKTYNFSPEKDFGTLDWGRGVWTYDNTWYWGSGSALVDGIPFGFNIGCGFGDTSAASENMLFYDGVCHKLDRLHFEIPKGSYLKPWRFVTNDGRFDMDFVPVYDNRTHISLGILSQNAHQVFGKLHGKAILDNGTALDIQDMFCFAEQVRNRY